MGSEEAIIGLTGTLVTTKVMSDVALKSAPRRRNSRKGKARLRIR